MIEFDDFKIPTGGALVSQNWNDLLDESKRYFEGNVGIGLGPNTPEAKLHVEGTGRDSIDFLVNGRMHSSANEGGLWVGEEKKRFVGARSGAQNDNQIGFYNKHWRLLVNDEGHVGIGTDDPKAKLDVWGHMHSNGLILFRNSSVPAGTRLTIQSNGHRKMKIQSATGILQLNPEGNRVEIGDGRENVLALDVKGTAHAHVLEVRSKSSDDKITISPNGTDRMGIQSWGSSTLQLNPTGNKVEIGDGREGVEALDVKGAIKVHGVTPIQIHRITGVQSGVDKLIKHGTKSFNDSEYNACIVGYNCTRNVNIRKIQVKRKNGAYHISSLFNDVDARLTVDVMIIRYGLSFATGN